MSQDTVQCKYNPQEQQTRARHSKLASSGAETAPDTLMEALTAADSEVQIIHSLLRDCDIPVKVQSKKAVHDIPHWLMTKNKFIL